MMAMKNLLCLVYCSIAFIGNIDAMLYKFYGNNLSVIKKYFDKLFNVK